MGIKTLSSYYRLSHNFQAYLSNFWVNQNSHFSAYTVSITCNMYCSIIRGECHSVARLFKRDYNLSLSHRRWDATPIGAWRSPASALAWGARGRRFKSSRPDSSSKNRPAGRTVLFYLTECLWNRTDNPSLLPLINKPF